MVTEPDPHDNDPCTDPRTAAAHLSRALLAAAGIEVFLTEVAQRAVGVVDAELACGLTVQATPRSRLLGATTGRLAQRMDAIQYDLDDGPCLTCLRTGMPVAVDDIATDTRWPLFTRRGRDEGAARSLSVPMTAGGATIAALNLYSRDADAFTVARRRGAQEFAEHAAATVALALRLAESQDHARHLQSALSSRSVIDRTVGVLMREFHIDADAAFALLVTQSQHSNTKIRDLAPLVLDRYTRRPDDERPARTRTHDRHGHDHHDAATAGCAGPVGPARGAGRVEHRRARRG